MAKFHFKIFAVLILGITLSSTCAWARDRFDLKLNLSVGDSFAVRSGVEYTTISYHRGTVVTHTWPPGSFPEGESPPVENMKSLREIITEKSSAAFAEELLSNQSDDNSKFWLREVPGSKAIRNLMEIREVEGSIIMQGESIQYTSYEVVDTDDDNYWIEIIPFHIYSEKNDSNHVGLSEREGYVYINPVNRIIYDSRNPPAVSLQWGLFPVNQIAALYRPQRVLMTPQGEVIKVELNKKIQERFKELIMDDCCIDKMRRDGLLQFISKSFSEEKLKKQVEKVFKIYPKNPVRVGDKWTIELLPDYSSPEVYTFTLKERADGFFHVAFELLKVDPATGTTKIEGKIKFDETNGWPNLKTTSDLRTYENVTPAAATTTNVSRPLSVKNESKWSLLGE